MSSDNGYGYTAREVEAAITQAADNLAAKRADLVRRYVERRRPTNPLTPSEWRELEHLARGWKATETAVAQGVAWETIRARRKRIYRKLDVGCVEQVLGGLLDLALEQGS